jgi:cytochrome P450
MKFPRAYTNLMAEIDDADSHERLSRQYITYRETVQLPYLVACCKEGMRLHPSIGLSLPRHVPAGGRQIAGHFFPAGTTVGISAPVLHANKEIFGEDAATFNPDRWLRGPDAAAAMDRHMFHFGAGSRTCIGKNVSSRHAINQLLADLLICRCRYLLWKSIKLSRRFYGHTDWSLPTHVSSGIRTTSGSTSRLEIDVRVHTRRSSHPGVASSSGA